MKQYGIELEFFIYDPKNKDNGCLIYPSDIGISSDGNPVVGEIRTDVCNSIGAAVGQIGERLLIAQRKAELAGFRIIKVIKRRFYRPSPDIQSIITSLRWGLGLYPAKSLYAIARK